MDPQIVVHKLHAAFRSGKTRPIEFRKQQLQRLHDLLTENKDDLIRVLREDLRKPTTEAILAEIQYTLNEVCEAMNELDDWVAPEYVPKNLINKMNTIYNIYEPLGVSLIIGAWNYPVQLILAPFICAIAAGNCALLKPSELSENTAELIESLVSKYMDRDCYAVMQGGVKETTEILKCRFDHVFYTGSTVVGKIVARAGVEHLSKITLELGGKSPCYVSKDSDIRLASRRIIWGKFSNAGQTCIAPDYVLCHPSVQDELIKQMRETIQEFFGEEPKESSDFGRIINSRHFDRLQKLMSSGRTVIGGNVVEEEKYIAPTVMVDVSQSDPIMQEEIFGPLLPVINVEDTDQAIDFINGREKPLALYVFAKDQQTMDKFVAETSSGGFCGNDTLIYFSAEHLPFGGVGHSGTGAYHGKIGFEEFSHKKAVYVTKQAMESVNTLRYPPYNDTNLKRIVWLLGKGLKRTPSDLWYIPCMLLGILFSFIMKIIGLPRYFLS
ncbi:aldehyde dehydrogenase, dimeric NADP-preferring-like [Dendronephthya gigantea]|uniref:aldehyde dehydrogenase, dimeric NADP-preferring-like n=1 Tax=Dendronephthya gigantea TaxID=151771 RepID=UPI00106A5B35|nr:aldehyde dehydrogenase, dimeric NADP-preferring-like [Dendronephthya gigantea]